MDAVSHLLTTNTPPNPPEAQYIQDQIKMRTDAIEKLQLELASFRTLLSPLRHFPLEILGEIFCATLGPTNGTFTPRSPRQLIWLSLVCKAWRRAALATPRLWGSLQITFNHNSICFEGARLWVSRARATPLTLILNPGREMTLDSFLYEHEQGLQHNCPLLNPGLLELIKTGPRIGALSVTCQSPRCLQRLTEVVGSQPWRSIHTFEIRASVLVEDRSTWARQVFPFIPPSATSLSFDIPFVESVDFRAEKCTRTRTLLGNLTSLTFSMIWPNTLERTPLSLCPSIQMLCLELILPDWGPGWDPEYDPGSVVTLPNLRTLQITGSAGLTSNHPVLECLETPRLISLEMTLNDEHYFYDQEDHLEVRDRLVSLIERSQCEGTFRRLRIDKLNITSDGLVELLAALPHITHLTLDNVSTPSDSFFRNRKVHQEKLFSRLQVFEWYNMEMATRFQDICEYLSEFPDVRAGHPTLKKLTLQSEPGILFPDDNPNVVRLKEAGVEVEITDGGPW